MSSLSCESGCRFSFAMLWLKCSRPGQTMSWPCSTKLCKTMTSPKTTTPANNQQNQYQRNKTPYRFHSFLDVGLQPALHAKLQSKHFTITAAAQYTHNMLQVHDMHIVTMSHLHIYTTQPHTHTFTTHTHTHTLSLSHFSTHFHFHKLH